jgi:hypothetical protein
MGEWVYRSHVFLTSAQVGGEWSASRPGRFSPKERAPGTHWIGGWAGPRDGLDDGREKSWPYRDSNSDPSVVQSVANRYTDCVIPASIEVKMRGSIRLLPSPCLCHSVQSSTQTCLLISNKENMLQAYTSCFLIRPTSGIAPYLQARLNILWYTDPLLGNDRETKLGNDRWTAIEERCFLCGPCRDVISRTSEELVSRVESVGECLS